MTVHLGLSLFPRLAKSSRTRLFQTKGFVPLLWYSCHGMFLSYLGSAFNRVASFRMNLALSPFFSKYLHFNSHIAEQLQISFFLGRTQIFSSIFRKNLIVSAIFRKNFKSTSLYTEESKINSHRLEAPNINSLLVEINEFSKYLIFGALNIIFSSFQNDLISTFIVKTDTILYHFRFFRKNSKSALISGEP